MLRYSPKIIQDGLVMCLDPSQNKSYPTTDLPVKDGLVMWMDAADDTTFSYSSGTTVTQWRDKSPSGFHMVPKSAGPTRSTALNSRKTLTFTTSQTIGNNTINLASSANTVFVVSRYNNAAGSLNRVLTCNLDASGNNWLLGHWGGYVNQYYAEGWVRYQVNAADTTWRVYMADWSGASTDLANLYSNGTGVVTNSTAASAGPNKLGINYYSGEPSDCEVAEIVVFNRILTTVERKLINTYLGQKWGILNTDRNLFDLSNYDDNALLGDGTTANMPFLDYYNNGSFKFDGTNDFMSVTRTLFVPLTICGFIKYVDQSKSYNTFINGYPHQTIAISLNRNGSGNLQVFLGNGSAWVGAPAINSSITLSVDTWYHITFTCDGTTSTLYINGVSAGTSNVIPSNFGSYFYLGHLTGGVSSLEYLKGNLAGVQVYTSALTSTQVVQNYEAQKSRYAVSLVQQGLILNLDAGNPYSYAGAGTTWYDTSGNNYNGTLTNGPVYNTTNGGIIVFDGVNDYVDLTSATFSISGNTSRSMFAWVKMTYNGNQAFIATGTPAGSQAFILVKYGSYVGVMGYNNDFYPSSGKAIADGNWHYVGATFDGTNIRTYVDGVLDNTSGTYTFSTTGQNNYVGKSNHVGNENYMNGSMGNAQIYNRTLSASEVLQNYNAIKGRFGL